MPEGQKFLWVLIIPNYVALIFILIRPDLAYVTAYVIGWNVLILPHLNQFLKGNK